MKTVVVDILMVDTKAGHHWLSPAGKAVPKPTVSKVTVGTGAAAPVAKRVLTPQMERYHARRRAQRAAEVEARKQLAGNQPVGKRTGRDGS